MENKVESLGEVRIRYTNLKPWKVATIIYRGKYLFKMKQIVCLLAGKKWQDIFYLPVALMWWEHKVKTKMAGFFSNLCSFSRQH